MKMLSRPARVTLDYVDDDSEWDDFVTRAHGGDVAQLSAWGRVKRDAGMDVFRVVARVDGIVSGGAQVLVHNIRPVGRLAYIPYGPLVGPTSEDVGARLIEGLHHVCHHRAIHALVVQPPLGGEEVGALLRSRGFRPTGFDSVPSASMRLDLHMGNDELLARMSKHTRRDFKQSLRGQVRVRFATRDELRSFHALYRATAVRQRFTPWSLRYLESVWDELHPDGRAEVLLASVDGIDVAGNLVSCFGDVVTSRIVGFDPSRLPGRIRVNEAVKWELVQWARARGFRWLDVGGVERQDALMPARDREDCAHPLLKMRLPTVSVVYPEPLQWIRNPILRRGFDVVGPRALGALRRLAEGRIRQRSRAR